MRGRPYPVPPVRAVSAIFRYRVPPAGFKYLVTEMVCWATGGPQKYTGRSMADSHKHLMIAPQEWEAFPGDFQQTLDHFLVPQREQ
jgi:hemoglobin